MGSAGPKSEPATCPGAYTVPLTVVVLPFGHFICWRHRLVHDPHTPATPPPPQVAGAVQPPQARGPPQPFPMVPQCTAPFGPAQLVPGVQAGSPHSDASP